MAARRRRSSSRRARKQRLDRLGVLLIATIVVVGAGIAYGYYNVRASRPTLDEATLCPEDGPVETTVVLIDRTDAFTPIQRAAIRRELEDLQADIPRYGALELYAVQPVEEEVLRPLAKLCNPGRGDEVSELVANPRKVERQWRIGFEAPLQTVFDSLLEPGKAPRSPIMESIQSVAVTALSGREREEIPRRLVIVSDMLQHTQGFSQYGGNVDFDAFRSSPYYRRVRADLRDVEVQILYVRRDAGRQGAEHVAFWRDFFADQGAVVTRVYAFEG